jgi:hypothetical protein
MQFILGVLGRSILSAGLVLPDASPADVCLLTLEHHIDPTLKSSVTFPQCSVTNGITSIDPNTQMGGMQPYEVADVETYGDVHEFAASNLTSPTEESDFDFVLDASSTAGVSAMEILSHPVATIPLIRQRVPSRSSGKYTVLKSVFFGQIRVGSTVFSTVFDSGSGHLILPGARCEDRACLSHQQYDPATSPAAVEINYDGTPIVPGSERDQLTVNFGTGEVTGVFVKDRMCAPAGAPEDDSDLDAASPAPSGACRDVQMIVATKMSDNPFADFAFDGVFGLALPGLSQTPDFNLATRLTKDLPSGKQAFSFYFSHEANGSKIAVGGLFRDRVKSPLVWVPVVDPDDGYWKLHVTGVQIGEETAEICADGCHGVADTGTSVFAAPTVIIRQIRERFQGLVVRDGKCQMPAHNSTAQDFVAVSLGDLVLRLYPNDFSQPRRPLDWNGTDTDDWAAEDLPCELMLMRLDVPAPLGPLVIFGEPFLTKYYTIFDVEHLRVGFAVANHEADEKRTIGSAIM